MSHLSGSHAGVYGQESDDDAARVHSRIARNRYRKLE